VRSLVMEKGRGPILGSASQDRPNPPFDRSYTEGVAGASFYGHTYAAQAAQVEVDRETGNVRVLQLVGAQDVGRAINPMSIDGQMQGGMTGGIGYALSEEIIYDRGRPVTDSFMDYRMPTAVDVPIIDTHIVEEPEDDGPFGAKSAGELPIVPTAGAIANAVYDAVGVRITDLPITPEKVLKALKTKGA